MFGAVHSLFMPQTGLQIANKIIVTIVLCVDNLIDQLDNHYQSIQSQKYRSLVRYITIPVKQLLSVHPLIHVQLSGAVHCLFLPHGGMQIAVLL